MSGLVPIPQFSYLTKAEREAIEDVFTETGTHYDRVLRDRLLDGVTRRFVVNFLPEYPGDPTSQLPADLQKMNGIERLTDGTVPLAQWLRNAVRRFNVLKQREIFEAALAKVTGTGEATVVRVAAAETPSADFEEILTDGVDHMQAVTFLSIGALRIPAVAKLLVPRYESGKQVMMPGSTDPAKGSGTAWLIAKDLVMTNYHVIRNRLPTEKAPADDDLRQQATHAEALFFFDSDGQVGKPIKIKELVAFKKDTTCDFALLRLETVPNLTPLPILDEKVTIPETTATPKGNVVKAVAVNIIQHPGGGPKRVALRNNLVYAAEYPKLHYLTDTLGGSSGSPVFDDWWRVVALHRAAVPRTVEFNGKVLGYVNEGIQIHAILAELETTAPAEPAIRLALNQIRDEQSQFVL